MIPFSSSLSSSRWVQQTDLTPISTTSTTGAGSKVDVKVIQNMFTSLKILGFTTLRVILQAKLFAEQYQQNAIEIATDISNTISRLGFAPDTVNLNWLNRLHQEGITKLLTILQGFEDNKEKILGVFNKEWGWKTRNAEIEIITLLEPSDWHAPHQLTITTRDGFFYLKQEGLVYDTKSTLITRKELLGLFREELNGVDLWLQDQCETDSTFEFDGNWNNLLNDLLSEAKTPNLPFNRYIRGPSSPNGDSIKICKEIIANNRKITDQDLVHILALTKIGKNINPMFILPLDLIKIEDLTIDAICEIWRKLLAIHYGTHDQTCNELRVMERWINKVILPLVLANADTEKWMGGLLDPCEKVYLIKYIYSLNDIPAFIYKNRYFAIRFLLLFGRPTIYPFDSESVRHQFLLKFYAKHTPSFFEICFLDQLCPDLAASPINTSSVMTHSFDFERLLPELRNHVEENLSSADRVSLSSTNKYFRQLREAFYDKKLETNMNEIALVMSECEKYKNNYDMYLFWDLKGEAFEKNSSYTSATTFMTYPQYRKSEYMASDLTGLKFLVYGVEVMGPRTIQKLENRELTLWDAVSVRLSLEDTLTTLNVPWSEFDTLEKYRLDGSLTEEAISTMTEQGKENLTNPNLVQLIDFRALSLERALVLNDQEVSRIARSAFHARLTYAIGVEQCLALTPFEHSYISSEPLSSLLIKKQLTLKAVLFIFHLGAAHQSGGWAAVCSLIKLDNSNY
jgi:hypothetical protein